MGAGNHFSEVLTRPYAGDAASDAARLVGRLTAIASLAAGVIHVSAAGDHTNLPVLLVGFLLVAALQLLLGVILLSRRPSRPLIAAALALMLGSVAVWLLSRTSGLPFLRDGHMEPVGFKDGICVLFELASVPGLLLLLSRDVEKVTLPSPRLPIQVLRIAAAAAFALMVPALVLDGGEHHSHAEAVALGIQGHTGESHDAPEHSAGSAHRSARAGHRAHGKDGGRHAGRRRATHGRDVHTEPAAFHPGHNAGSHAPGGPGRAQHDAGGRGHRGGGKGHDPSRRRQHDRDRRHGGGNDRHDDPHAGHEGDPEPADDDPGLDDVPAVCEVASAVMNVC